MDAKWMQARIATLERDNAALTAERDEAVRERDAKVERRVAGARAHRPRADQLEDDDPFNVYGPLNPETEAELREWIAAQTVEQLTNTRAWRDLWKRAAKRRRDWHLELVHKLGRDEFWQVMARGYHAPGTPTDEDEMIARLETTVRGWQPGTTAGKDCRGNVGDGYRTQEREDDHA